MPRILAPRKRQLPRKRLLRLVVLLRFSAILRWVMISFVELAPRKRLPPQGATHLNNPSNPNNNSINPSSLPTPYHLLSSNLWMEEVKVHYA